MQTRNVGGVEISIRGDNSSFKREMRETQIVARRGGQDVSRSFDRADQSVSRLNKSILASKASMLALAAAAGVALTSATRTIADFEQAMSTVKAVTNATESQMADLTAEAKRLGGTTRFSASQAAEGLIFLARAGFSAEEAMASLEGTLQLAQAGGLDLGRAADIASNVLSGFNLDVDQTGRVVDVLAKAANSANTDVNQLGEALKFAAPTAVALGLDLEQTIAAIGKLSDAGIQGGLAGRGFQSAATKLVQSKDAVEDIIGEFSLAEEGLLGIVRRLDEAGITTAEVVNIFRAENLDVYTILSNAAKQASGGLEDLENKLRSSAGTAAQVATTMDDNLNGAILATASALESLVLAIGEAGLSEALRASFEGLAALLRLAAQNADILTVAFVALSVRAVLPLVVSQLPKLAARVMTANTSLLTMTRTAGVATAATRTMGAAMAFLGGPATLAIVAAASAFVILSKDAERGKQAVADLDASIRGAQEALAQTQKYDDTFYSLGESAGSTIDIFNGVAEAVRGVTSALNDATIAGFLNDANKVFSELENARAALRALQDDRERLAKKLGGGLGQTPEQVERSIARTDLPDNIRRASQTVAILEQRFQAIGNNVFADINILDALQKGGLDEAERVLRERLTKINEDAGEGFATAATAVVNRSGDDKAEEQKLLQEILQTEFELEIARAKGDRAEIARLEDKLAIIAQTEELVRAGLTATKAEITARERVNALRAVENDIINQKNRDDAVRDSLENLYPEADIRPDFADMAEDAYDYTRDRVRDGVTEALIQAVQGGDWQDALGRTFFDVVSDSLRDSFKSILDELGSLLGDVLSGSSGNAIGDIFGSIFSGGRASGGNVSAGRRYLVGERGAEMFVPATDGYVISNEDLRTGGTMNKIGGGGVGSIRMGDIIVNGDPSGRTLKLIEEAQRRQAQQLPAMIDQRVQESSARGRYG